MESYLKRFFIGYFLILVVAVGIGQYMGISLITIIVVVLLLELLIYFLDAKYLPKRKTELAKKIIEIFNAEPVSEGVLRFKFDTFDFYAETEVDFRPVIVLIANVETVKFHIPKSQIDRLPISPGFELKEDKVNGIQTYSVYQSDGNGLLFAKEKLERMICEVRPTAS